GVKLGDLHGIAVTQGPGLVGSLLVGCSMAKALAWVHDLPLVGVNHLEGHIYAAFLTDDPPEHPFLALVVSGGHTALYHAAAPRSAERGAGGRRGGLVPGGRGEDAGAPHGARGAARGRQARGPDRRRGRQRAAARGAGRRGRRARHPRAHPAAAFLHRQRGHDRRRRRRAPGRRSARAPHAERRAGPGAGMNFQAVLAGLPDAVIAVDEALRVVFWNAAAEELTERSARRMEGRMLKEVFAPDASLVRRLSETLAMGLSRSETETSVERPDHRVIPVSIVTAPPFDRAGRVAAAVAVVRDLSRIRQLEAEVRRGETLAAAGRMAVGLAHEIRNPLGAIRGAVQLLGRELGAQSPLQEYTSVLLTEVDRVNRIIEMLLDLARPVTIRPVPLNLHQLLERVALLTEQSARERRVMIVRRYDPSLPPILGDEDRLVQVFHNLVRNAIEAM